MKVKIKDLKPNPFRDTNNYPMNEALADELLYKKINGEAHTKSFQRHLETAKECNALPSDKIKELEVHIQ